MSSFKMAAIKILRKADKPLHYEDITKIALEKGLIETAGATPEATMNAQISVDIKSKKDKSPFVRVKPGTFLLNPNYTPEKQKLEEKEEQIQETDKEKISSQYIGKGGEHIVVSELLFRGYNASIMGVDEGIDIVAIKENKQFNIQVKTARENKQKMYAFDIRMGPFEKHNSMNTFYVFVLKGKETHFLILPCNEISKNIEQKNILTVKSYNKYRVNIKIREGELFLGNKKNNMSYYMNKWDLMN